MVPTPKRIFTIVYIGNMTTTLIMQLMAQMTAIIPVIVIMVTNNTLIMKYE